MSRLVVFGATGGTGREVVRAALDRGIATRALVRRPGRTPLPHPELEVVEGDVLDPEAVEKAVAGTDTVISLLGLRGASTGDTTVSRGTENIVAAMEQMSVRRLVCQTCFGLGDSMAQARWLFRWVVHPFLRRQYEDRVAQEQVVTGSALDWTIVRPTHLVDGPATGRIRVLTGPSRLYDAVSRADVAAQLLAILADPSTHRQTLTLAAP